MCVPVIFSVHGGNGLRAVFGEEASATGAASCNALASRTISCAWIGLKPLVSSTEMYLSSKHERDARESIPNYLSFLVISSASEEMLSTGRSLIQAWMKDTVFGSAFCRAGDAVFGGPNRV